MNDSELIALFRGKLCPPKKEEKQEEKQEEEKQEEEISSEELTTIDALKKAQIKNAKTIEALEIAEKTKQKQFKKEAHKIAFDRLKSEFDLMVVRDNELKAMEAEASHNRIAMKEIKLRIDFLRVELWD